jgi:hypothetical protein
VPFIFQSNNLLFGKQNNNNYNYRTRPHRSAVAAGRSKKTVQNLGKMADFFYFAKTCACVCLVGKEDFWWKTEQKRAKTQGRRPVFPISARIVIWTQTIFSRSKVIEVSVKVMTLCGQTCRVLQLCILCPSRYLALSCPHGAIYTAGVVNVPFAT